MRTRRDGIRTLALAALTILQAGAGGAATQGVSSGQSCPPGGNEICVGGVCQNLDGVNCRAGNAEDCKSEDVNKDGTFDWQLSEMTDGMGNKVTLWCVGGASSFFALVYTPAGGNRRFIGKCAFDWGHNVGSKTTNDAGKFSGTMWMTRDSPGYNAEGHIIAMHDLDKDGHEDKYIFEYDVANNKVKFRNLEDGTEISSQMLTPKEPPFKITDLPGNGGSNFALDETTVCGCSGCMDEDATAPLCFVSRLDSGPPTRVEVTARDFESGIASIELLTVVNAKVEIPEGSGFFYVPGQVVSFAPAERDGTRLVQAEKLDPTQSSHLTLRVRNGAGLETTCDPAVTLAIRDQGKPARESFAGIPEAESAVTIYNGTPGVRTLQVTVNGKKFVLAGLTDGEERTLDVSAAMLPGDANVITLSAHGKPSGSSTVVIHD